MKYIHIWAGTKLRFQSLSKKLYVYKLFSLLESNLNTTQNSFGKVQEINEL